ncbi:MAG TPA: GNAT family N-acetyltransferase [Acidimicrobiales bacterium]|nr:GNAT family N-acetyltransferase [Acidimicrobiales bacterium]
MTFVVQAVDPAVVYPVRQQVLRTHQTLDQVAFPEDGAAGAGHFAAVRDGEILGVVTVFRQRPARWQPAEDQEDWWRLRGMATVASSRREGVGRALVAAVIAHVVAHGGTRLWCHARLAAVPFYQAMEFATVGEQWVEPVVGPHVVMWRPIP